MPEALPLDLVRVRLLELLTTDDLLDEALLARLGDDRDEELCLLLGRELARRLVRLLLVDALLVAPHDVLDGRLLDVLLDVVEGVLGDVGNAQVGVLLDAAGVRESLAGEELDEGRLARTVGTDCAQGEPSVSGKESERGREEGGDAPTPTRDESEMATLALYSWGLAAPGYVNVQSVILRMARVRERTPMSEPGEGNVNLTTSSESV